MKKYIIAGIMAVALLTSGCGKFIRDELISMQNEIDRLQDVVKETNASLGTLQAIVDKMAAGGFIVDVQETAYGDTAAYVLKFGYVDGNGSVVEDTDPVILRTGVDGRNGLDADPIVLGVKYDQEDDRWYWYDTQAGDYYLSDGKRIPVDGRTPDLKIEDGYWWVSWDPDDQSEDKVWTKMENWPAKGKDAPEVFSKVTPLDDRVELTLTDGTVLSVMRFLPVEVALTLDGEELGDKVQVNPGDVVLINYELSGTAAAKAVLVAGTDGRYKTSIKRESDTKGVVKVVCPEVLPEDGYIYITVNDPNGRSIVRVVYFVKEGEEASGEGSGEGENSGSGEGENSGEGNQEGA